MTESAEDSSSTNSAAAVDTGVAQKRKSSENAVYSETNVRQEGVDEADVVKTDGRYLYTLKDNGRSVAIVDTSNGELQMVISIPVEDDDQAREFYVNDGHLILVSEFNQEREVVPGRMLRQIQG